VFFGTPEFALPSFKALLASRHQVAAVVTQPDSPQGRFMKRSPSPVKEFAKKSGIPVLEPQRMDDPALFNALRALAPQCAVVVAYGALLPNLLLRIFPKGAINLHPSLLPQYRGAAPIPWTLIQGEKETGVTIFQLDEELDHGPILLQERVPIGEEDNALTLSQTLSQQGANALVKVLDQIKSGSVKPQPQDHSTATLAPRLQKKDGAIDWRMTAQEISNRVRGLQP
jgi:methionyl-tRNA formyltransferase